MHVWFEEAGALVRLALGSPGSTKDIVILSAIGVITLCTVMNVAGAAADMGKPNGSRRILGLLAGLVILLAAVTATQRLLLPLTNDPLVRTGLLFGAPAAVMLAVGLPLVALIAGGRYIGTLVAFCMSLFAAFVMIQVALALMGSLRGGTSWGFFLKSRRDSMNRFLETGR